MKLHNVTNISGLFQVLDGTREAITVETADGRRYDWDSQKEIVRSITESLGAPKLGQISLHFRNKKDANDAIYFLMECRRHDRKTA